MKARNRSAQSLCQRDSGGRLRITSSAAAATVLTFEAASSAADATVVDAGEAIIIQTPTAGGYGKPD